MAINDDLATQANLRCFKMVPNLTIFGVTINVDLAAQAYSTETANWLFAWRRIGCSLGGASSTRGVRSDRCRARGVWAWWRILHSRREECSLPAARGVVVAGGERGGRCRSLHCRGGGGQCHGALAAGSDYSSYPELVLC